MTTFALHRAARALALAAALGAAVPAAAGAESFNASIWFPDGHPLTKFGYLDWAKDLAAASGGRLEPRVFTGTALLSPAEHLSGLRAGVLQVGYHAGTYSPAELPADNVLAQLAFSYSVYFLAAFAITDMNMTDPEAQAQWKRNGVVYAGGYATVPYILFCTEPVRTLADIAGRKVRMPGSAHSNWAKSAGAVPVNVASSEMYGGLEKGQLDCASNGANELRTRSLWEVAKYVTTVQLGVYYAGCEYCINRGFWAGLAAEDRRVMLDTIATAMVRTGLGYQALAREVLEEAPQHGVTLLEPAPDLAASVADYAAQARTDAVALGRDKLGVPDPEALIGRFEARVEKWRALLDGIDRTDEQQLVALLKRELFDRIDAATYGVD